MLKSTLIAIDWFSVFSGSGFERGVQGDLFVDDPEVIQKLSSDQYDYNSDSDLESISDETDVGFEDKAMVKSSGHSVNEDTEKYVSLISQKLSLIIILKTGGTSNLTGSRTAGCESSWLFLRNQRDRVQNVRVSSTFYSSKFL